MMATDLQAKIQTTTWDIKSLRRLFDSIASTSASRIKINEQSTRWQPSTKVYSRTRSHTPHLGRAPKKFRKWQWMFLQVHLSTLMTRKAMSSAKWICLSRRRWVCQRPQLSSCSQTTTTHTLIRIQSIWTRTRITSLQHFAGIVPRLSRIKLICRWRRLLTVTLFRGISSRKPTRWMTQPENHSWKTTMRWRAISRTSTLLSCNFRSRLESSRGVRLLRMWQREQSTKNWWIHPGFWAFTNKTVVWQAHLRFNKWSLIVPQTTYKVVEMCSSRFHSPQSQRETLSIQSCKSKD